MNGKRQAVIASRIFEPENSAAAFRLAALARALGLVGFDVSVLTSRPQQMYVRNDHVSRFPVLRDKSGNVRGYLQYASFDIPLFFRLLLMRRPDVVVVEPPPTTGMICRLVCGLRRIPYVYYAADVSSTAAEGIGVNSAVVYVLRRVELWVLQGAARVLAVSDGVRNELLRLGTAPSKVIVVGTGIDTEKFTSTGATADADFPYLVYAGTMSEVHGAGIFVEAFAQIANQYPTSRLLMFGDGKELVQLKKRAAELSDRIEFRELVDPNVLAPWLRGARAGLASVRPDRGYSFAIATKALTALSCGTPVVYAGAGPLRNIVERQSLGWSVEWRIDEVATALGEALTYAPSAEQRAHVAVVAETDFSLRSVARRAADAIIEAISHN